MSRFSKLSRLNWFFEEDPGDGGDPGGGGGGGGEPPPADPPTQNWPDNWRQLYAGEDEKKLSHLSRYASPEAAFDGLIAAKAKFSSGEYKSTAPFPEQGTDEDKASWREHNGIPLQADQYKFDGIDEDDQDYVKAFSEYAYNKNIPQTYASEFLGFLREQEDKLAESDKDADLQLKQETEDKLRLEWGGDYRRNLNMIDGLLDMAPEGISEFVKNARGPDGTPLASNLDAMRWLADLALQINPVSTVVPNTGGNMGNTIEDEIAEIEHTMRTNNQAYWADQRMQDRYEQLLQARINMAKKRA